MESARKRGGFVASLCKRGGVVEIGDRTTHIVRVSRGGEGSLFCLIASRGEVGVVRFRRDFGGYDGMWLMQVPGHGGVAVG
jgi:hypothetical protein